MTSTPGPPTRKALVPSFEATVGWFNASDDTWDELPDVAVLDLPDGFYLVSPGAYFWGPRPTLEDLNAEVFTGASPGGPTLDVTVEDWYLELSNGLIAAAWRPNPPTTPGGT